MKRGLLLIVLLASAAAAGCQGGVTTWENCSSGNCVDPNQPGADGGTVTPPGSDSGTVTPPGSDSGTVTPPKTDAGGPTTLPDCKKDADCTAPYVCHIAAGKCVPPSAQGAGPCDPIEGKGCPPNKQCISGLCLDPPGKCKDNGDCPIGYICKNGTCVWAGGGTPCMPGSCPAGKVCVNGVCVPKEQCKIPNVKNRLQAKWRLDSRLHTRDGLQGFTKGLLGLATTMNGIITGNFKISGVPSWLTSLVAGLLKNTIQQYVPPWAQQVITLLANVDDAIDDWRVISMETLTNVGNAQYVGQSEWLRIEFEYKGIKVSNQPQNIPGLGKVTTEAYTAREVCGVLFMDKHKVKNAIGRIFRWAVEALITGISCSMQNVPCYKSINAMFADLIDCPKFAKAVASGTSLIPGLESLVLAACQSQKQTLVQLLIKELDDMTAKMTTMSLAGKADINKASNTFQNGKWYGTLGGSFGNGNFEGTFIGNRQP